MKRLLLFVWFLTSITCWADDVVVCDPTHPLVPNAVTRFDHAIDGQPLKGQTGFLVWQAPHNLMTTQETTYVNQLRGQLDALAGVPNRYWICTDTTPVDGILESIREMTQAEKDAIDAPTIAEQARQQAFTDEVNANDLCTATLTDLTDRINQVRDSLTTDIQNASTVPQLKLALANMNQAYTAAFRKTVRCIRARAR